MDRNEVIQDQAKVIGEYRQKLLEAEKRISEFERGIQWALDNPQSVFLFDELRKLLTK